jgi:hypothetical protein
MRVLLLCVAAFAVGLLAGVLFWPREETVWRRVRTPRESAPADAPRVREPVERGVRPGDADVGALAREAEAALERNVPRDDDPAAGGTITGSVRGPEGEPIAGVIVSAFPNSYPAGVSKAQRGTRSRERRHEDLALSAVAHDAILRELWRRRSRGLATTGADGRYEMRVLATVSYRLYAFHERYTVEPASRDSECAAGSVVDFRARIVVSARVEVRMPDGTLAKTAWLRWRGLDSDGYVAWEPQKARVRLPPGPCWVKAQAWAPDPLQSDEVKHALGTVLVLHLRGRRVLKARLVLPEGLAMPGSVEYRLRCLADSDEPDPASLRQDRTAQEGHSSVPGQALWFDLAPGRYLVVAFLGGSRFAHAVVEVGDGPVDVDLQVPDPAADPHVTVKLLGPDGGFVTGRAWFRLWTQSGSRPRYHGTETLRRKDGSWMLLLKDIDVQGGAILGIGTDEYGFVERPIDVANAGSITVHFVAPARARLRVEGYAGSGLAGRLAGGLVGGRASRRLRLISADGTCELAAVQPGDYGLQLILRDRDGKSWPIAQRRVVLEAGVHEHTMAVPVLQTLRVRPTGRLRRQTVTLHCTDPAVGSFRREVRLRDGVAVFEQLGAGSYEIECRDKRLAVRVPGPAEVTIE